MYLPRVNLQDKQKVKFFFFLSFFLSFSLSFFLSFLFFLEPCMLNIPVHEIPHIGHRLETPSAKEWKVTQVKVLVNKVKGIIILLLLSLRQDINAVVLHNTEICALPTILYYNSLLVLILSFCLPCFINKQKNYKACMCYRSKLYSG